MLFLENRILHNYKGFSSKNKFENDCNKFSDQNFNNLFYFIVLKKIVSVSLDAEKFLCPFAFSILIPRLNCEEGNTLKAIKPN